MTYLKQIMARRGITSRILAERAGVSYNLVGLLRTGKHTNPSLENARTIARVLATTIDELWPEANDEKAE